MTTCIHQERSLRTNTTIKQCRKVSVEECYIGRAGDLYPDIEATDHWSEDFVERLSNDKRFYMECNSPHCDNKVPHEGLVIKIDNGIIGAFKLKCFKFLNKEQAELDSGEANIEDVS